MINKNIEIDDCIELKKICYATEGVVVSQEFQRAMDRQNYVKEVGEDYVKISWFDEKIPLSWVDHIVKKHYTDEEYDRKRLVKNEIKKRCNRSFGLVVLKILKSFVLWEALAIICLIVFGSLLDTSVHSTSNESMVAFKGLISSLICAFILIPAIGYFSSGAYSSKKCKIVKKVIKDLNISAKEALRLKHYEINDDDGRYNIHSFYEKDEIDEAYTDLNYYNWTKDEIK